MQNEYYALKLLEKPHPYTNSKISPKLFEYKSSLQEFMNEVEAELMISHLINSGYAELKEHDRISFTKDGYIYFDKTYWLQQAYEIIDNCLNTLLRQNDAVNVSHKRGNLKIEQKVKSILESGLVNNLSHKRIEESLLEITEVGRTAIEDFGGIESFLKNIQEKENIHKEKDDIDKKQKEEIQRLTLLTLQFQNETNSLKKKIDEEYLPLIQEQRQDLKDNAIDRKTVIQWQIATAIIAIVAFLLKLFGVKGWLD